MRICEQAIDGYILSYVHAPRVSLKAAAIICMGKFHSLGTYIGDPEYLVGGELLQVGQSAFFHAISVSGYIFSVRLIRRLLA